MPLKSWVLNLVVLLATGASGCGVFAGHIHRVSGQVVDEAGRPIPGVKLSALVTDGLPGGERSRRTTIQTDSSGRFRYQGKSNGSPRISFYKAGFHDEYWDFTGYSDSSRPHPAPRRFGKYGYDQEWSDLRVVMTKVRPLTELDERGGPLTLRADGSGSLFTYDRTDREGPLRKNMTVRAGFDAARDVRPMHPIAEPGIKVASPMMNGRLVVVEAERESFGGDKRKLDVPSPLRLVAFGNHSGFIRYDEGQRLQGNTVRGRHLLEAPLTGYERELTLTPEEVMALRFGSDPVYFYLRLGDKFGRGRISRVVWNDQLTEVEVVFGVQMQPDGSRNLETGERF